MGRDEKIREAQQLLDWVIMHLNFNIKCKVIDYKGENYRVQVFKEDKLIMPIQFAEQDVKEIYLNENFIPDKLNKLGKILVNRYNLTDMIVSNENPRSLRHALSEVGVSHNKYNPCRTQL